MQHDGPGDQFEVDKTIDQVSAELLMSVSGVITIRECSVSWKGRPLGVEIPFPFWNYGMRIASPYLERAVKKRVASRIRRKTSQRK